MGLMDEIQQDLRARRQVTCTMGRLLLSLPPEDAKDLTRALSDDAITARAIARVLVSRGHDINDQSVNRHRRGLCGCARG